MRWSGAPRGYVDDGVKIVSSGGEAVLPTWKAIKTPMRSAASIRCAGVLPARPRPAVREALSQTMETDFHRLAGEYLASVQEPSHRGYRGHGKAGLRSAGAGGSSRSTTPPTAPCCREHMTVPVLSDSRLSAEVVGIRTADMFPTVAESLNDHAYQTSLRTKPAVTSLPAKPLHHHRSKHVCYTAVLLVPAAACTLLTWRLLPEWWELSAYFWYSIPGESFVLLPHEPVRGVRGDAVRPSSGSERWAPWHQQPASVIDYQLFERAFRLGPLAQANQSRISVLAQRAFNWQPWWTIVVFAFSPLPFYPVRIAAPMSGYPAARYVAAMFDRTSAALLPPGVGRRAGREAAGLEAHHLTGS